MLRHFVIIGMAALFMGTFVATDATALDMSRIDTPTTTYPDLTEVLDVDATDAPLGVQVARRTRSGATTHDALKARRAERNANRRTSGTSRTKSTAR
jgi:hypothetical protein